MIKLNLSMPTPDRLSYEQLIERGFRRFPEKEKNFIKYKNSKRNSIELDYLPVKMDYEVVSRCNFRCKMCRVSEWKDGKRTEDMSYEDFSASLDELLGLFEIKLQGAGEPLLHPRIFDMIALAAEKDIWTRLSINGSLLHLDDNYKKLIDANPGEIQVSFDAATKEVFESIRRGANFEKIIDNSILLNDYALMRGVLKTRSWTVVQQANLHQLEDIIRLGQKMKFKRMTFCLTMSDWGLERWTKEISKLDASTSISQTRSERLVEIGKGLGIEVTFWYASSKYSVSGGKNEPCPWLFERAFISSDMRIVPCCVLSSPDIADFGNAKEFVKEWNNSTYQHFRRMHLEGRIPKYCRSCYEQDKMPNM